MVIFCSYVKLPEGMRFIATIGKVPDLSHLGLPHSCQGDPGFHDPVWVYRWTLKSKRSDAAGGRVKSRWSTFGDSVCLARWRRTLSRAGEKFFRSLRSYKVLTFKDTLMGNMNNMMIQHWIWGIAYVQTCSDDS